MYVYTYKIIHTCGACTWYRYDTAPPLATCVIYYHNACVMYSGVRYPYSTHTHTRTHVGGRRITQGRNNVYKYVYFSIRVLPRELTSIKILTRYTRYFMTRRVVLSKIKYYIMYHYSMFRYGMLFLLRFLFYALYRHRHKNVYKYNNNSRIKGIIWK